MTCGELAFGSGCARRRPDHRSTVATRWPKSSSRSRPLPAPVLRGPAAARCPCAGARRADVLLSTALANLDASREEIGFTCARPAGVGITTILRHHDRRRRWVIGVTVSRDVNGKIHQLAAPQESTTVPHVDGRGVHRTHQLMREHRRRRSAVRHRHRIGTLRCEGAATLPRQPSA